MDKVASPTSTTRLARQNMRSHVLFWLQSWPTRPRFGLTGACVATPGFMRSTGINHRFSLQPSLPPVGVGGDLRAARVVKLRAGMFCRAGVEAAISAGSLIRQRLVNPETSAFKGHARIEESRFSVSTFA